MSVFEVKTSDTSPDIKYQLQDGSGNPISLAGASNVKFRMGDKIDSAAEVLNESDGIVKYRFTSTDTSDTGTFNAEWEVDFDSGDTETFPNSDYIRIRIVNDLA